MKKETDGCWDCDKCLLKFLSDNIFYNVFDVGADVGIEVCF